jgi:hypothetical protein
MTISDSILNLSTTFNFKFKLRKYFYDSKPVDKNFQLVIVILSNDRFYSCSSTVEEFYKGGDFTNVEPFPYYKQTGIYLNKKVSYQAKEIYGWYSREEFYRFYDLFVRINTDMNYAILNIKHEDSHIRKMCQTAIRNSK